MPLVRFAAAGEHWKVVDPAATEETKQEPEVKDVQGLELTGRAMAYSGAARPRLIPKHHGVEIHHRNGPGYRELLHLPAIDKPWQERKITVFVGARGSSTDLVKDLLSGPNHYNRFDHTAPRVPNEVVDATKFTTLEELRLAVARAAQDSDAIVFQGHGTPTSQVMTDDLELTAEFFRGLDLSKTIVAVDGCNTGTVVWRAEHFGKSSPNRRLIGAPVPREQQLLEALMRYSKPRYAIGNTQETVNGGARLAYILGVEGGGQDFRDLDMPYLRVLERRD